MLCPSFNSKKDIRFIQGHLSIDRTNHRRRALIFMSIQSEGGGCTLLTQIGSNTHTIPFFSNKLESFSEKIPFRWLFHRLTSKPIKTPKYTYETKCAITTSSPTLSSEIRSRLYASAAVISSSADLQNFCTSLLLRSLNSNNHTPKLLNNIQRILKFRGPFRSIMTSALKHRDHTVITNLIRMINFQFPIRTL